MIIEKFSFWLKSNNISGTVIEHTILTYNQISVFEMCNMYIEIYTLYVRNLFCRTYFTCSDETCTWWILKHIRNLVHDWYCFFFLSNITRNAPHFNNCTCLNLKFKTDIIYPYSARLAFKKGFWLCYRKFILFCVLEERSQDFVSDSWSLFMVSDQK